jgi:YD repeat-containing protein
VGQAVSIKFGALQGSLTPRVFEGGIAISGATNSAGELRFAYTPPRQKGATAKLIATCGTCGNTATKVITVSPCDICTGGFGNPIQPGTGEKHQTEIDYSDTSVHPLGWSRNYRSFGNLSVGLGQGWAHAYAASVSASATDTTAMQQTVRFGDGSKVIFSRADASAAWVADNGKDTLVPVPAGWVATRAGDESRWLIDAAANRLVSITQRNGWVMTMGYNPLSQLTSVTNAFGRSLQLEYDASGRISKVNLPDGRAIRYAFDSISRLIYVGYPDNSSKSYAYENGAFPFALTGMVDESGQRIATYAYDTQGRATSTSHAGGAQAYSVNYGSGGGDAPNGALVAGTAVDPSIYRSTVQVTDPLGNPQTWVYQGGDGNIRVLGANGAFMGGQVANTGFVGTTTLPALETDFLGINTLFTWDTSRRLKLAETKAAGRPEAQTVQTQWHPLFRLPELVTEAGKTTAYTYDALGNILTQTVTDTATGQARTWAYTYTPQGLVASMTDPRGSTWAYGYDAQGNRTSERNPLGHDTTWQYDGAGRVTRQTDPNGLATTYTYDLRGRLTQSNRGGEITTIAYTPTGNVASAAQPNGHSVAYEYDVAQRLVAAVDNRGNRISYTLDAMGNRVREEVKDGSGAIALVTSRVINNLNKVAAVQGAVGQTTQIGYDANGEPISQTDPLNQTTRQALDGLRRPTATTLADNAQATQAWNQLDQLTQVTDPKGVATLYTRNAFGEVMSETSPDIGTTSYQRDAAGNVVAMTDAKGITTQTNRDALGRPQQVSRGGTGGTGGTGGGHQTFYTWDQGQVGYLGKVEDPSGVTTFTRDINGNLTQKVQAVNDNPANPASFTTAYAYTSAGVLDTITYPSGLKVTYKRNAAGQITGIDTQAAGRNKPVNAFVSSLTYTALGQPKAWAWANGDSASRSFDTDGRMTATEFATYGYDTASRITSISQSLWATSTATGAVTLYTTPLSWTAGYDNRNRLTQLNRAGAETTYTYDANSNRLSAIDKTTSDTDLDGEFDDSDFSKSTGQALNIDPASNKLLGFTQTFTKVRGTKTLSILNTNVAYTLDANGALTSDGLRDFEYDEANRLSKVKIFKDGEAAKVRYLHNALGQRVFKSEPEAEQTLPNEAELGLDFISLAQKQLQVAVCQRPGQHQHRHRLPATPTRPLPTWALMGEYDNGSAAGKGRTEYIWLPTDDGQAIPVGIFRNGKFFAIHTDHLGTPRLMTNEDNKPVWQWPYSAFGNNKPTGVLKATPNPKAALTNQPTLLKATARQS